MKEGGIRTASTTVRLNSCLEESGVQATPRNARIDVEDVHHVVATIGPSAVPCIATKERTSPHRRSLHFEDFACENAGSHLPGWRLSAHIYLESGSRARLVFSTSQRGERTASVLQNDPPTTFPARNSSIHF
jgi:hypothetical protein